MIMAELSYYNDCEKKKNGINHWVLYSLLIMILTLKLFFSDSGTLMLIPKVLYAIW